MSCEFNILVTYTVTLNHRQKCSGQPVYRFAMLLPYTVNQFYHKSKGGKYLGPRTILV